MNSAMTRSLCRLLVVLMAWVPFHVAQAGLISTEQAVASAQSDRVAVLNVIQRADVARQLQAFGVDLAAAKDRVGAMTDEEVRSLASTLQSAPAGADGTGVAIVILLGVLIWYFYFRR